MRLEYSYPIDQCDIHDKSKVEEFRKQRIKWISWLIGSDQHAISRQISSMLWGYAVFSVVNELRRIGTLEADKGVGFNGPVMRLFDAGFVSTQATAIRRLIEEPKSSPKLAVISLRSILEDIKKNAGLFTRENYVCHDGLPYDHETVHHHWLSKLPIDTEVYSCSLPVSGPTAWATSARNHNTFDELSGVSPSNRKRHDTINAEIFEDLASRIESCEDIKKYVDKFLAHAAAPETREELTDKQRGVTLERLKAHHKTIYQVAEFISTRILYGTSLGGVPVPQFDHLENLDKCWSTSDNLDRARKTWDEYSEEVAKWNLTPILNPG